MLYGEVIKLAEPKLQKNGKYRLRAFVGTDDKGKEIFKSFTGKSEADCRRQYKAWLSSGGQQKMLEDIRTVSSPTVKECITAYIDQCKKSPRKEYSPSTIRGYINIAKSSFDLLNDKKVDKLSIDDLQDLIDYRAQSCVTKTIRNGIYLLRPAIRPYRPDLDFTRLVYPDQTKDDYIIPTDAQMQQLLNAYQADDDMYIATVLGGFKGMRRSEICALTWGDIDRENLIIHVTHALVIGEDKCYHDKVTKTVSGKRDLDITPEILDVLKRRALIGGKLYDPNARLVTTTPAGVSDRHARMTARLGHDYTFHGLRHYHCSTMIALGVPFSYIVHDMGHADDAMAKRVYGQMIREKEKAVARMVNGHAATVLSGKTYDWGAI